MELEQDLTGWKRLLRHGRDIWIIPAGLVVVYLSAIVLANLVTARLGPPASIVNAFLFIGLDLTSRDRLHDAWKRRGLFGKMAVLIAAGSLLSWILNRNAGTIALASMISFAAASAVDSLVYPALYNRSYLLKVNGSNVVSALVDSLVFPTVAFGGFLPLVTLGQFLAKVFGGAIWSYIFRHTRSS